MLRRMQLGSIKIACNSPHANTRMNVCLFVAHLILNVEGWTTLRDSGL